MVRLLVVALLLLLPRLVGAGESLDVRDWLARPGVKLLAVEFYASWCGPCKKAVPQWKELHERYRDQGLRLVVVSVQDPDGACVNPGWNPDDVVCDSEGRLAEAWGVGDRLPAAFLWSWRGTLLVRKGHVDEVELAAREELGRMPRVTLDEGMDSAVRELLRSELARSGKVDVVAGGEEEEALAAIRRKSHDLQFSESSACRIGERLAANSLVRASFVKAGTGRRLLVQLFSAETGCLNGSAGVFWNEQRPELAVAEAVGELVNNLRVAPELPGASGPAKVATREIGEQGEAWEMAGSAGTIAAFESEPPGAVVLLDGKVLCMATPCSKLVAPGSHKLELQFENYVPVRETITITDRTGGIKRELTPDFGWLTVRSTPPGLPVTLDGKPWGTTPVERRQVASGPHRVLVSDPRFFDKGMELAVDQGEHEVVEVEPARRQGGLELHARDLQGNDLRAQVTIDGSEAGQTPYAGKLDVGDHQVRVSLGGKIWERSVAIQERQVEKLVAELELGGAVSGDQPEPESPTSGRTVLFQLGLSLSEGMVLAGQSSDRSPLSAALAGWLQWGWFRWEPLSLGVAFEGSNVLTLGSGACWHLTSALYLRTLAQGALADGYTFWGALAGAGYGIDLGKGWLLDAEVDGSFWPGEVTAMVFEARLGVRFAF